jgi:uridine kinase
MPDPITWAGLSAVRRELLESLVAEFLHHYPAGRRVYGVDGPEGGGKKQFAEHLAIAFARAGHTTFHTEMDAFMQPREFRERRGPFDPEGRYRDSFDLAAFRRVLVEPFRMGGSAGFQLAVFDPDRDAPVESEWSTGPADAILIVHGPFLNSPDLRGVWNRTIWVDADRELREAQIARRLGHLPAEVLQRDRDAERLYVREAHPNTTADAIIDNTDKDAPVRRFADFCTVEPAPR